ncbi:MAG TPA: copper resistance protein CopC [Acidimicrobiales bacterium]|nr:copper resistance protein CopC [Acidimicrobiales bacterium]
MSARAAAGVRGRAVAAALVLGAGLLLGDASPAGAHATLVGTVPAADAMLDAAPDVVELQFDEPVEVTDGAVQVFGPGGERVDRGTVDTDDGMTLRASLDADDTGTYTVAWRVTSEDSHTITGSFVFHNGTQTGAVAVAGDRADTATTWAGGVGRWLALAGMLAAAGSAVLALLLPRRTGRGPAGRDGGRPAHGGPPADGDAHTQGDAPAHDGPTAHGDAPAHGGPPADGDAPTHGDAPTAGGPGGGVATLAPAAPPAHAAAGAHSLDPAVARLRALAAVGALAGAAGAAVALVAMLAESAGRGLGGAVSLVPDLAPDTRTGQLALARIALCLVAAAAAGTATLWRRTPLPVLVPLAAALVTVSAAGHAWTAPDRVVAVASDVVHLGAVAVWAGGLLPLLVVLPLLGPDERRRVTTRFSTVAVAAVVVVALSGTVSGWQQVRTLDALTSTTYGRLVLAKVAGLVVLVALGWVNRARLVPLVRRATSPLRRSLRIEVAVAALVLAVTAALIHEPPARTAAPSGPYDTTATADGGQVMSATVDPATAGSNDIHLYFFAGEGGEPLAVDAVQVTAGTADVPARRLQVTPVTTDHVTVAGASLPTAGTWTVEVTAVQAGEPLVFTFEVPIA